MQFEIVRDVFRDKLDELINSEQLLIRYADTLHGLYLELTADDLVRKHLTVLVKYGDLRVEKLNDLILDLREHRRRGRVIVQQVLHVIVLAYHNR